MRRFALIALLLLLANLTTPRAQEKPDFSGEWTLNRPASTLSPAAAGMQSGALRIEHRDPKFHYAATLVASGTPIEYVYELSTDGTEVTATQQGRRSVSSLRWDGNALVFVAKIQSNDPDRTININFRYELLEDGRRLRAIEQLRGGGRDQDNVWIYDRR